MTPPLFSIGMYDEVAFLPSNSCFSLIFRWPCHLFRVLVNKVIWLWQKTYGPEHILRSFTNLTFHNVRFLTRQQLSRLKELSLASSEGVLNANGHNVTAMIQSCCSIDGRAKRTEDEEHLDKLLDSINDQQLELLLKGEPKNYRAILAYFVRHHVDRPLSFINRLNPVHYGTLFSELTKSQTPKDPFQFIATHLKETSEAIRDQSCNAWLEGVRKEIQTMDVEKLVLCVGFFRESIDGQNIKMFTDLLIEEILKRLESEPLKIKEGVDRLIESIKRANSEAIKAPFEGGVQGKYQKSNACLTETQCRNVIRYCDFVQALKLLCIFRYDELLSAVIMAQMEANEKEYGRQVANLDMQTLSRYYDTTCLCFQLGERRERKDQSAGMASGSRLDRKVLLFTEAFRSIIVQESLTITHSDPARTTRCRNPEGAHKILRDYSQRFFQDQKEVDPKKVTPRNRLRILRRRSRELFEGCQLQQALNSEVISSLELSDSRGDRFKNPDLAAEILTSHRPEQEFELLDSAETQLEEKELAESRDNAEEGSPIGNSVIRRGKELFLASPESLAQASIKFSEKIIGSCAYAELKERNIKLTDTQLEWLKPAERQQALTFSRV